MSDIIRYSKMDFIILEVVNVNSITQFTKGNIDRSLFKIFKNSILKLKSSFCNLLSNLTEALVDSNSNLIYLGRIYGNSLF